MQNLAMSGPGSWALARVLRHADRLVLRLSAGRTTLSMMLTGLPVAMITTTGARSGLPRTSPLVRIGDPERPGRFALIASNFGQHRLPSWYFNLKKSPRAVCTTDGRREPYVAHEAAGDEYDRFWGYAVDIYFGYALYKQRAHRRIPIMVMEPE